jgi:hypothetical protein
MSWNRRLSVLGLALLLTVGVSCTSEGPTEVSTSSSSQQQPSFGLIGDLTGTVTDLTGTVTDLTGTLVGTVGQLTDLLTCSPQKYAVTTATIDSKGGTIKVGSHSLVIPKGALSGKTKITAEQMTGTTNSIRFSPDGLRFEKPAALTMTYNNCILVLIQKKIVYTDEKLKVLEVLRSLDLFKKKTVTAPIDHFSRYAVAF